MPRTPPTLLHVKLAGLPTGPATLHAPATAYGNAVYGMAGTDTVFTEMVTETETG